MKRYTYHSERKSRREKISFFTAFSICIVAIGLALWSTFLSINDVEDVKEKTYISTYTRETLAVDNEMTGVTETVIETQKTTEPNTQATVQTETQGESYTGDNEALQTILQVSKSLDYPVGSKKVQKQYSEEAIYSETMGDYRVHGGVDFEAYEGESVSAMSDGVVESIYYDDMLGNVIVVRNGTFSIKYCGVEEEMCCEEGGVVSRGDVIAKVGKIPSETEDSPHLHIEVLVGDKNIDPLTVISNDR